MRAICFCLTSLLLIGSSSLIADDSGSWPAFQGRGATKLSAENLQLNWSKKNHISWRVKIPGYGQSSPVIFENRVYVTSVSGNRKETFHLTCFDLKTGKRIWKKDVAAASRVKKTNYVSKAAPTPIVDADGPIAFFESGNLVAFTHSGEIRWQKNLVKDYGPIVSKYGLGSSLARYDDSLILSMECDKDPYLLSVERKTGKVKWKVPGLGAATWSTPVLLPVGHGTHLVLSGSGLVVGFDPASGKRLWSLEGLSGNSVPTPYIVGNGKLLLGASDRAGDGPAPKTKPQNSNGLVEISKTDKGSYRVRFLWRAKRATSSFGSPVVAKDHAYFVNRSGVLYCLDLAKGQQIYTKRIGESIWATPLVAGDRIYFPGKKGTTTVVKTGPKFVKLAVNQIGGKADVSFRKAIVKEILQQRTTRPTTTFYAIAAVNRSLILRSESVLYCIRRGN